MVEIFASIMRLPASSYELPATSYKQRASGYDLVVNVCELCLRTWAESFRLWVALLNTLKFKCYRDLISDRTLFKRSGRNVAKSRDRNERYESMAGMAMSQWVQNL